MMTAKEQQRMARLEIENRELRDQLSRHMEIYRNQLFEIVELRTKLELVEMAIGGSGHDGEAPEVTPPAA